MLNGGLWRVRFWKVCKLLILERETGLEPATSSLGSWHSTTELLPLKSRRNLNKNGSCRQRQKRPV